MKIFPGTKAAGVSARWPLSLTIFLFAGCLHSTPPPKIDIQLDRSTVAAGGSAIISVAVKSGNILPVNYRWTLTPNVGLIAAISATQFRYTAPSFMPSGVTVKITLNAAGLQKPADASLQVQASAAPAAPQVPVPPEPPTPIPPAVAPVPVPEVLAIIPASANLQPGAQISFSALLNNSATSQVNWQLAPAIGTISAAGIYVAPSSVAIPTTIQVSARLATNTGVTASAQLTLVQPVTVSINPPSANLTAGQTLTLAAVVGGTTNQAVTWRLTPAIGTINNGVYTAPETVSADTTVQVTATSVADSNRSASSALVVKPVAIVAASSISLPVEVFGPAGTIKTVYFDANASQAANAARLYLRVHGLVFSGEASVQVNNQPWVELTDSSLDMHPLDVAYGGIGGGSSTIRGALNLAPGSIVSGSNTLRFRFNRTDGFTQGFRVLSFNLQSSSKSDLLAANTFVQDNPSLWTAPISGPEAISAGRNLWYNANLSTPLASSIKARCTDCHTHDGRDLKYFNYSNFAIRSRAQFHGLSATEGDPIASYIRSLNMPSPGRPWNPPYQPGPGIDAKPVSEWAAGAGLDAVLDRDRDMIPIIFPNGINTTNIRSQGDLSARSTPIAMQLPDWNHWLPQIHPKDAYTGFETSTAYTWYQDLRRRLVPNSVSAFLSVRETYQFWPNRRGEFFGSRESTLGPWSETRVRTIYSSQLWGMVKNWELNQEFGLEAMSRAWHGPQADDRAWTNAESFQSSPHMLKLPSEIPGVRNGKASTYTYISFIWYHLQLILNNSNKHQDASFPIDWNYSFSFVRRMGGFSPQGGMLTLWTTKGLQIMETGVPPGGGQYQWSMDFANITQTNHVDAKVSWIGLAPAERNLVMETLLRAWLDKAKTFTPRQYWDSGQYYYDFPHELNASDGTPASRFWHMLIQMKAYGLRQDYLDEAAAWAQSVWPTYIWSPIGANAPLPL